MHFCAAPLCASLPCAAFPGGVPGCCSDPAGRRPPLEETHLSSLIDERSFKRVQAWLTEARLGGAQELIAPTIDPQKRLVSPTLLTDLPSTCHLAQEEAFAPFAEWRTYDTLEEALHAINASPYGLQAGVYTQSEALLKKAFEVLKSAV